MLKLPKIDEELQPLKLQYQQIIISKTNSKNKNLNTKFDWLASQINLINTFDNEILLKQFIQFQTICKTHKIDHFYSYFFLKSLLINKQQQALHRSVQKLKNQEIQENKQSIQETLNQLQLFIINSLTSEGKKISNQNSFFHKIQNYILLRQDLLKQIQKNSKDQSHNSIHQNANDIRFLNFQIIQLIKEWKNQLQEFQKKYVTNQVQQNPIDLQNLQPIFFYQEQNYLNKMIYDNANVINTVNHTKNLNFISPPNPFFLSQDGNKQSMSQKQKDKIQETMQYLAKQKALQLKLLLQRPQYIAKGISMKDRIKSSNNKIQKAINKKSYESLPRNKVTYNSNSNKQQQQSPKKKIQFTQKDKIISAYQTKTSKLRSSVEQTSISRSKFQNLIKNKQIDVLKQIRKKKSPPKDQSPKLEIHYKSTNDSKLIQSPYKEKLSTLRKQIQKNVNTIKLPVQTIKQQTVLNFSKTQNLKFVPKPLAQVKAPKPKIKLVTQRQITLEKPVNFLQNMFSKKIIPEENDQKNKQKQQLRKSHSTFFKSNSKQQIQKNNLKLSRVSSGRKIKLTPVNVEKQKQTNLIKKRSNSELKNFTTSSNFLYKPSKLNSNIKELLRPKRPSLQKQVIKYQSNKIQTKKNKSIVLQDNQIDNQLENLKGKIRQMQIMKVYGKKKNSPGKRLSESHLISPRQHSTSQYDLSNSPYKKQNMKNSRSILLKKEASMLQLKIEKLLKKQQQRKSLGQSHIQVREEDQSIINQFKSINNQKNNQNLTEMQINEKLTQNKSIIDQNLMKLQKKRELIEQSNEIKVKQLQANKKNKQKVSEQIKFKEQKLKQLEEKIRFIKANRKVKVQKSEQKIKQSLISQPKSILVQETASINNLKVQNASLKKQHQKIHQQIIKEEQKFIKLKQEQYKMREEANRKKYLHSLQQIKSNYLEKQRQYEGKILEEQKKRKQNEIQLMKQKRQGQQLKMKLQQQQMKEILLKEILEKQKQREQILEKQTAQYETQIRTKIQAQIKQKQQIQRKIAQNYEYQNVKMLQIMSEIQQKNRKIEQTNKKRIQQVQRTMQQKQQQRVKLQQLQNQVSAMQILRLKNIEQKQINQALNKTQKDDTQMNEEELQTLKLKVKQQILKQILQRRKKQEQEQLIFEQERKKRIQKLQNQIKDFLKKQDLMVQEIQNGNIDINLITNQHHQIEKNQEIQEKSSIINEKKQKIVEKVNNRKDNQNKKQPNIELLNNQSLSSEKMEDNNNKAKQSHPQKQKQKPYVELENQKVNKLSLLNEQQKKENNRIQLSGQKSKPAQIQSLSLSTLKQNILVPTKDNQNEHIQNILIQTEEKVEVFEKQEVEQKNTQQKPRIQKIQLTQLKNQIDSNTELNNNQIQTQRIKAQERHDQKYMEKSHQKSKQQSTSQKIELNVDLNITKNQLILSPSKPLQKQHIQNHLSQTQQIKTFITDPIQKQQPKSTKSTIKQSNQQILQKYELLKTYFNQKTKVLIIQQPQIQTFVNKFYSQFPIEVKEMLPYTKSQIQTIMKNHKSLKKKIDIYDCNSLGWYDAQSKKYTLLGSIQCIHLIAKKYGQVQIQLVYIFNRSNSYQKQFLAKQIKLFQKTGYVYQKKMKQQNLYSIKFIMKIPKQAVPKGFQFPDQLLKIDSTIIMNSISIISNQEKPYQKTRSAFWYLLGECLLNNKSHEQIEQFYKNVNKSLELNLFIQNMKNRPENIKTQIAQYINTQEQNICEFKIGFKLPYIQLGSQLYISLLSQQFTLSSGQKAYVSSIEEKQSPFKVLVMEVQKSQIQKNYLQTFLQTRINEITQIKSLRQLHILLPKFKINSSFNQAQTDQLKLKFNHRLNIKNNLIPSSISTSNSFGTEQRKIFSLEKIHSNHGFIFSICYSQNQQILNVLSASWVGWQDAVK